MIFRAALAALAFLPTWAFALEDLNGRWRDNAPNGDPIGVLVIGQDRIQVGRKVTYRVKPAGAFGEGRLFEVVGMDRRADPEGCGSGGKVRWLAVEPLPPVAPGIGGPAIRVFFYSGASAPTPKSIDDDIALCSIRPFDR